jgi:hypothetical protein
MKEANRAYEAGDEAALRAVLEPTAPPQTPHRPPGSKTSGPPPSQQTVSRPQTVQKMRSFKSRFWPAYSPWLVLWLASDLVKSWDAAGVPVIFFLLG